MLDKNSSTPLYELVKEYILKLIVSGKYPANSQLPTEFKLMKKLGVGRATVRAALSQLENEGIVEKKHGVGTFVVDRSKAYGFEPFISLSFMLEKIGLKNSNKLISIKQTKVESEEMCKKWQKGENIYHIKRHRYAENYLIALEDFYITEELYEKFDDSDLSGSIAHSLLTKVDIPIKKITNDIVVREPISEEEQDLISSKNDTKLVELTRWLYYDNHDEPSNFVKFVVPLSIIQFPFFI